MLHERIHEVKQEAVAQTVGKKEGVIIAGKNIEKRVAPRYRQSKNDYISFMIENKTKNRMQNNLRVE